MQSHAEAPTTDRRRPDDVSPPSNVVKDFNDAASKAILTADRLEELLCELGGDFRPVNGGQSYRGPCPVHRGDGRNCTVWPDGKSLPISWHCFSHDCQRWYGPSLVGLIRGVLSARRREQVPVNAAVHFLDEFLGSQRPAQPEDPPDEEFLAGD